MYHPRYNRFKPQGSVTSDYPLDLTWIFYPPEGEECFVPPPQEDDNRHVTTQESTIDKKVRFAVEDSFDVANMRPYWSLTLPVTEDKASHHNPNLNNWGSYINSNTISNVVEQ